MKIYYAHHQWKYNTPLEDMEIKNIKNTFKDCEIINPNGALDIEGNTEEEIMEQCFEYVRECDIVAFSTIQYDYIGIGVYQEILEGFKNNKEVYLVGEYYTLKFTNEDFDRLIITIDHTKNERLYAKVI